LACEFLCFLLESWYQGPFGSAVVEVWDVTGGVAVDAVVVAACVWTECEFVEACAQGALPWVEWCEQHHHVWQLCVGFKCSFLKVG